MNRIESVIKDEPEILAMYRAAMLGVEGGDTTHNNVIGASTPQGNSRAYSIDRVKREAPNFAARVRGIAPERLCFAPVVPLSRHLGRLACADIYLDAWPCNAHTTASEALWMGVPVVSLAGNTFAQRVGASLLHAAGLDELICSDAASYSQQVLALAEQPQRRAAMRQQLQAQRASCSLFDGPGQARHLEALVHRMWQRAVSGQAPEHLEARS